MDKVGQIEFYTSNSGELQLDVKLEDETVWLSQEQMASLFNKDRNTVTEHISNIYKEGELNKNSTTRKYRVVRKEGSREISRQISHYNLDVIISVGYRVKSKRGTQFRIWANSILKEYLRKGYAVNTVKLEQQGKDISSLLSLLEDTIDNHALASPDAKEMISIIKQYAKTFSLLQEYDTDTLIEPKGEISKIELKIKQSRSVLAELKQELIQKGEATDFFAKERDNAFSAIIGNIEQTFDGKPLYSSIASKAAHLLYFIVKDHPFSDGNKRSAAFMFLHYLSQNNALVRNGKYVVNEGGLVAITLLIAESNPAQKELMVKLVQNLIQ